MPHTPRGIYFPALNQDVKPVSRDMEDMARSTDSVLGSEIAAASQQISDDLKEQRRVPVVLTTNADLNYVTKPDWYIVRVSAGTIGNRPQGFNSPFEVTVTRIGLNALREQVCQIARMPEAGSTSGRVAVRYGAIYADYTEWGPWNMEHGPLVLASGDDLDNWVYPTQLEAPNAAIAASIANRPMGFDNQFVITVHRAGSTVFQTAIGWASEGVLSAVRRTAGGVFGDWVDTTTTALNEMAFSYFGDSQVAGTWPSTVASYFPDYAFLNYSAAGDSCQAMMIRHGFYTPKFQVDGGEIPADSVPVQLTTSASWELRENRPFAVGTIAGVVGQLKHVSGDVFEFTRTTAGVATPAPGWQQFTSTTHTQAKYVWFEIGGNNFNENSARGSTTIADYVLGTYRELYDWCIQNDRTPIFAGVSNRLNAITGSEGFDQVNRINSELRRLYPNAFIDKQAYLVEHCIYDARLTPTEEDLDSMSRGEIPPQLFADNVHLKPVAYEAFGRHRVAPWLAAKGYLNTTETLEDLKPLNPFA